MEAVIQLDGGTPGFECKDSVERKLLSSVCHDYGSLLTARFYRELMGDDKYRNNNLRKLANNLIWLELTHLHPHAARKVPFCGRLYSLKTVCCSIVSKAITKKLKAMTAGE